jgi:hypothetical protein
MPQRWPGEIARHIGALNTCCTLPGVRLSGRAVTDLASSSVSYLDHATVAYCLVKAEQGWRPRLGALRPPADTCSKDERERPIDRIGRMQANRSFGLPQ